MNANRFKIVTIPQTLILSVLLPLTMPFTALATPAQKVAFSANDTTTNKAQTKVGYRKSYLYRAQAGDSAESIAFEFLQNSAKKSVRERFYAHNNINPKTAAKPVSLYKPFHIPMDWMYLKPMNTSVVKVSGSTTFSQNTDAWQALNTSVPSLKEGSRIKTDSDGFALLEFPDHSLLSISPNSIVRLETVRRYATSDVFNIQVHVESGRIESQVKPLHHPASDYSVKSKRLSTAVRGTRFSVSDSDPATNAITEVLEGGVQLAANIDTNTNQKNSASLIPKGFAAYVKDTQVSELVALLPAPQWVCSAMQGVQSHLPLVLLADKNTQRFKLNIYRGETASLNAANSSRTTQAYSNPTHSLSPDIQVIQTIPTLPADLPEGRYTLQVSAIDSNGIHGVPSVQTIRLSKANESAEDLFRWQQNVATRSWVLLKLAAPIHNTQLTCLD
jgi:hypothetical protein